MKNSRPQNWVSQVTSPVSSLMATTEEIPSPLLCEWERKQKLQKGSSMASWAEGLLALLLLSLLAKAGMSEQ